MSVQAIGWVLDTSGTKGSDRLVMIALANHAGASPVDGAWESYPGIKRITSEAGFDRERTTQEALARLEAAGHITRVINGAPDERIRKDRRPNLYRIMVDSYTAEHGVSPNGTPVFLRGDASRHDGVTPHAERGDASRHDGVTPHGTQTIIEPSVEPSVEPSPFSSPEELAFDAFWAVYPKRRSKPDAVKALARALKRASLQQIVDGARAHAEVWVTWPADRQQYIPHPATWLNRDSWEDPPPERHVARSTQGSADANLEAVRNVAARRGAQPPGPPPPDPLALDLGGHL